MKKSNITRYASLVLAIGFFVSCAGSKFSADNLISEGNYQQAIDEISAELMKNPSASLYYQKGEVHGLIAKELTASERTSDYSSMITAFDSAKVYASNNQSIDVPEKVDSLTSLYWNMEHRNGLTEYQKETEESVRIAIDHFNNAILIKPENIESYKSLSIALYNNDDIDGAISALQKAESINNSDTEIYESLGFLYLEIGNPEESIKYYRMADQDPVKNKNIAFGLVNAFISQNNTSDAISFLDKLIEEYPEEAKLHNVYGTQLYNQTFELFSDLRTSYSDQDTVLSNSLRVEIEGVSEQAENQLIEAYKLQSTNIEFVESLAVFYNNMSGNYFSIHEVAFQEDKESLRKKALTLTDFAITYYTQLADSNAQESSYTEKIKNLNSLKESWNNK